MDDAGPKLEACDASVCDVIWASSGGLLIQDICWLFSTLLFQAAFEGLHKKVCNLFPGGKIERGETVKDAAVRELYEETSIVSKAFKTFNAVDAFDFDSSGKLRHHFVLVAVLCIWVSGDPLAGDDALEARFFDIEDLINADLALSLDVKEIALQAAELL